MHIPIPTPPQEARLHVVQAGPSRLQIVAQRGALKLDAYFVCHDTMGAPRTSYADGVLSLSDAYRLKDALVIALAQAEALDRGPAPQWSEATRATTLAKHPLFPVHRPRLVPRRRAARVEA